MGVAHGTIFGLGAVFATKELASVEQVSVFMACFLLGSIILQWPAGWLADRINRRVIMAGMCALSIAACFLATVVPTGSVAYFAGISPSIMSTLGAGSWSAQSSRFMGLGQ